jgi:tetratricopeptide (TPR) repeat protein
MNMRNLRLRNLGLLLAATVSLGSSIALLPVSPAQAQVILQEQGTLQPTQAEYTFSGTEGQVVTIALTSPDFDTVLSLVDANNQEVASNDDYARSLNSTIVVTLPRTGAYKVLARSFSGQGGNYSVVVRPATPYEQSYFQAYTMFQQGDFDAALTAYNQAIQLDPGQPIAYADRGDVRSAKGEEMPNIIADYQQAIQLYQQAGDTDLVQMLQEQINYLQNPSAPPVDESNPTSEGLRR